MNTNNFLSTTILGFSMMNIIAWLVFGFIAGIIVHAIDRGDVKGGVFGSIILGILGAIIGGFISATFLHITYAAFSWQALLTAVVGGLILAFLSRLLFRNTGHIKTQPTNIR